MGKKKKTQRGQKEKRVAVASPQSAAQNIENVVVASPKERKICSHLEKGVEIDKLTSKFSSTVPVKCEDCREGALDRRAAKSSGKGKSMKRKGGSRGGQSKSDSKSVWVCLECGHFSCGGAGFPTTPQSHALRHSRQYRHPLAVNLENPNLRWCFPCSSPIPVFKSDEQKDLLPDILKIIKSRPVEINSVDIEDVWFGTGISQIKPESSNPCKDPGGGYAVRGLVNLGNTCFFNSVVQNLLAMDKVREYFLNLDRSIGPLTVSLKKLYVETNPSSGLKNVVNPKPFLDSLCTKFPQFRGFEQHDSHELLRCLLDNLCSEEQSEQKELNSNSSEENGASLDLGLTFVDNFFAGKLSSTVCCLKCKHSSVVHEPFLDLSLPVPTKNPPPKRVQPVLKGKKPKLPPKRTGIIRPKLSRDTEMQSTSTAEAEKLAYSSINSSHSSPLVTEGFKDNKLVESTLLGSPGIETKKLVENVEVDIETPTWLDFVNYDTVSNDDEIETNKLVENIEMESEILPLDVDYGSESNDNDKSPQTENGLAIRDHSFETSEPACSSCANEKKELPEDLSGDLNGKKSVVNDDSSVTQDSFFQNPNNNNTPNIGSGYSCEEPVQAQDSEIILLPYKEEGKKGLPVEQNKVDFDGLGNLSGDLNGLGKLSVEIDDSSVTQDSFFQNPNNNNTPNIGSGYSCEEPVQAQDSEVILLPYKEEVKIELPVEQNTVDFDGLGDLFNEPDDLPVMGPTMMPSGTSFTAGFSSGSDPDEVDNSNSQVSVESCLAHFTKLEILSKNENAWFCESCSTSTIQRRRLKKKSLNSTDDECLSCNGDSCSVNDDDHDENADGNDEDDDVGDSEDVKGKRDATKRLLIDKAPPILTIHLVRFTQDARGRLSKLKGHVAFKEVLDLRPYMNSRYTEKEEYKYRLVGVVEHLGSMRQGHYVAYVRGAPKKITEKTDEDEQKKTGDCLSLPSVWYYTSDTHVREATFNEVLNCEAYILFYVEI